MLSRRPRDGAVTHSVMVTNTITRVEKITYHTVGRCPWDGFPVRKPARPGLRSVAPAGVPHILVPQMHARPAPTGIGARSIRASGVSGRRAYREVFTASPGGSCRYGTHRECLADHGCTPRNRCRISLHTAFRRQGLFRQVIESCRDLLRLHNYCLCKALKGFSIQRSVKSKAP